MVTVSESETYSDFVFQGRERTVSQGTTSHTTGYD